MMVVAKSRTCGHQISVGLRSQHNMAELIAKFRGVRCRFCGAAVSDVECDNR